MVHIGKKDGFEPIGLFCFIAGIPQLLFHFLMLGNLPKCSAEPDGTSLFIAFAGKRGKPYPVSYLSPAFHHAAIATRLPRLAYNNNTLVLSKSTIFERNTLGLIGFAAYPSNPWLRMCCSSEA